MPPLKIPTISLAKSEAKEGSREWLREIVKEHGSTAPLKLEERRQSVSAYMTTIRGSINKINAIQKLIQDKMGKVHRKLKEGKEPPDAVIAELESLQIQDGQYEIILSQLMASLATLECNSLIVDCLSVRRHVQVKGSKKVGYIRRTLASILTMDKPGTIVNRLREIEEAVWNINGISLATLSPEQDAKLKQILNEEEDGEEDSEDEVDAEESEEVYEEKKK